MYESARTHGYDSLLTYQTLLMSRGRMGNLDKWAGPLPRAWMKAQLALQRRIVNRMRQLAIQPILPAFAGHVPAALSRYWFEQHAKLAFT